jgi:hypothetical protein
MSLPLQLTNARITVGYELLLVMLGHALQMLSPLAEAAQEYELALGLAS